MISQKVIKELQGLLKHSSWFQVSFVRASQYLSKLLKIIQQASEREVLWVMRVAILLVGGAAMALGIVVDSIYGLFYLCSDLIYVILFPQLLCCVHLPFTNTYGSMAGFILGLFFRLAGGEVLLNFPPLIKYWYYDEESGYQCFPFKTMAMLISLVAIILGSLCASGLFLGGVLPPQADIARVFHKRKEVHLGKELRGIHEDASKEMVMDYGMPMDNMGYSKDT